jgi:aspartate racemase
MALSNNQAPTIRQTRMPGLLGMSVFTDCVYLKAMHGRANARLNAALNSLRVQLHTINFVELIANVRGKEWLAAERLIEDGLMRLSDGGSDFVVVSSNTGSSLAEPVFGRLGLPVLRIADVTCRAIEQAGHRRIGLLSTVRTSDSGLYQNAAAPRSLEILPPSPDAAAAIESVIFDDLIYGRVTDGGLAVVREVIDWFAGRGADAVVFACTDLTHMDDRLTGSTSLPFFDSTLLHAKAAADVALGDTF